MFSTYAKKHEAVFFTKNDQKNDNEKQETQFPPVNYVPFGEGVRPQLASFARSLV